MNHATLQASISSQAYRRIADLVYEHSRIRLGPDKQALVAGRISKRLRTLQLESFEEYCEYLQSSGGAAEIGPLIDAISTNHTHFFREMDHLTFLRDQILPEKVPGLIQNRECFRLWSAACSSGEEPYTLAIVLAEYEREHGAFKWEIEASDISSRILEKATNAIYSEEKTKMPHAEWLARYFQKGLGEFAGCFRVKENLRQRVTFHRLNLLQPSYPVCTQQHVIFCRNVMIYFDTPTQQELVGKLVHHLVPHGYLVVGHSESLIGIQHPLKTIRPGVYQKS